MEQMEHWNTVEHDGTQWNIFVSYNHYNYTINQSFKNLFHLFQLFQGFFAYFEKRCENKKK